MDDELVFVWRRFNFHVIEADWHSLEHRAFQVIAVAVLMATVEILACRLGIEGAEFGGERVASPRIGGSAIAGSAHQISQHSISISRMVRESSTVNTILLIEVYPPQ